VSGCVWVRVWVRCRLQQLCYEMVVCVQLQACVSLSDDGWCARSC
jgi:hypothetical protein